jgi:hypothetical protein
MAAPDTVRQAARNVGCGLAWVRQAPRLYLLITLAYTAPAAVAAGLTAFARDPVPWQQALLLALPWVTIVLGAVVIMVAVGFQSRGQIVSLPRATRVAARWVPRYLWTNVHTSIIFWVPIGLVLVLRQWLLSVAPDEFAGNIALDILWWLLIASLAVYLHTRTLLAPFLAVHGDLPATLAMLMAWRLAGRHFGVCLATLVVGSLPVALPLVLLALALARTLEGPAQAALVAAAPGLAWVGIQLLRPVLIPALFLLYRDLWLPEQAQFERQVGPHIPRIARLALALTRPLPKPGAWD